MCAVMPKDIKKWKPLSLANGMTSWRYQSISGWTPNLPLRKLRLSSKSSAEWGNYQPDLEPMLVVVGRVPTALELQDFS